MTNIHILDAPVYNKISAGEVIEKPASVVKELVENALDAGADDICVRFTGGGLDEICVTDNGCGIDKDDLSKVFLPHATSKIETADDLFNIRSLGFRGEAMASIAAVAMVKLTSRKKDCDAYSITCSGNEMGLVTPAGGAIGTDVEVRNLFYHTPARLKFLRSAKLEGRDILSLCERIVIAHPLVRFTLLGEGKTLLQTSGDGLESAVNAVFGEDAFSHMLPIEKSEYGYTIKGYISDTDYTAGTRANQITVVNGRVIANTNLYATINNAYHDYLMKRNYALYAIHITVPTEEIDVNVHPTKSDIRFVYSNKIFGLCYRVVRNAIEEYLKSRDIIFNQLEDNIPIHSTTEGERIELRAPDNMRIERQMKDQASFVENNEYALHYRERSASDPIIGASFDLLNYSKTAPIDSSPSHSISDQNDCDVQIDSNEDASAIIPKESPFDLLALRVVGQVLGTYIIAEYKGDVLLIDQHAAAEKVLYNRFLRQYAEHKLVIQPMLIPYSFQLGIEESGILQARLDSVRALGIDLEQIDDTTYQLNAVPALLTDMDINQFIHLLLSDHGDMDNKGLLREKLAYTACRAAIKGNTYMDKDAVELLCKSLFGESLPAHCPHGRPAYIVISKQELDKMFKRIV